MGRLSAGVLLAVMILIATGAMVGGARECESKSHRFKGRCVSGTNCGSVCQTEGFHGGYCRGLRGRCFCTRPC